MSRLPRSRASDQEELKREGRKNAGEDAGASRRGLDSLKVVGRRICIVNLSNLIFKIDASFSQNPPQPKFSVDNGVIEMDFYCDDCRIISTKTNPKELGFRPGQQICIAYAPLIPMQVEDGYIYFGNGTGFFADPGEIKCINYSQRSRFNPAVIITTIDSTFSFEVMLWEYWYAGLDEDPDYPLPSFVLQLTGNPRIDGVLVNLALDNSEIDGSQRGCICGCKQMPDGYYLCSKRDNLPNCRECNCDEPGAVCEESGCGKRC